MSFFRLKDGLEKREDIDIKKIKRAYELAKNAHKGQKRKSGEDYISHPLETAIILSKHNADEETIIAALLHDTVEDTSIEKKDIEKEFGASVSKLVEGVTKFTLLEKGNFELEKSLSLQKFIKMMSNDLRVLRIKLADRLHNIMTLESLRRDKQTRIALETIDIYIPLARLFNIWNIARDLEDECFKYILPVRYDKFTTLLKKEISHREEGITKFTKRLKDISAKEGLGWNISYRKRGIFSLYQKCSENLEEKIKDIQLFSITLVVDSEQDCYNALYFIHSKWRYRSDTFKDFVSFPRPTGYRGIHTHVIDEKGGIFRIKIITKKINELVTLGAISKSEIKEDGILYIIKKIQQNMQLLKKTAVHSDNFIGTLRTDILAGKISVFSNAGNLLELPAGSTVIDAAYAQSKSTGNSLVEAMVNKRKVPLYEVLSNGDNITFINSAEQNPKIKWLGIVKTENAKNYIRDWFQSKSSKEKLYSGAKILEKEFKKFGLNPEKYIVADKVSEIIRYSSFKNIDDVLIAVGEGSLQPEFVVSELLSNQKETWANITKLWLNLSKEAKSKKFIYRIDLGNYKDYKIEVSKCCRNIKIGEEIFGVINERQKELTIYKSRCENFKKIDSSKTTKLKWNKKIKLPEIKLVIIRKNSLLLFEEILEVIKRFELQIVHESTKNILFSDFKKDLFTVKIENIQNVSSFIGVVESIKGVIKIIRK